jgi:flagellar motor switch/type III secretory pathway protein FliN
MAEQAVAPTQAHPAKVESELWEQALALRGNLSVDMLLPGFTVGDALRLQRNSVIDSQWRVETDIPLRVNGRLIACGQFEVVGNRLAVRLTELV